MNLHYYHLSYLTECISEGLPGLMQLIWYKTELATYNVQISYLFQTCAKQLQPLMLHLLRSEVLKPNVYFQQVAKVQICKAIDNFYSFRQLKILLQSFACRGIMMPCSCLRAHSTNNR